jgi:hypothetical protein
MRWMIDGQLGRKNLNPFQWVEIVQKYRPALEEKAKENQGTRTDISAILPKGQPIDVRKELAKTAGVKERTYSKAVAILNSDNEKVKQEVRSGKQTINSGYNEIRPKAEPKAEPPMTEKIIHNEEPKPPEVKQAEPAKPTTKKCLKCKQVKPISEFKDDSDFCNKCMENIYTPIMDNSY